MRLARSLLSTLYSPCKLWSERLCKMKVLMTADPMGDLWTYILELTRTLVGDRFVIASSTPPAEQQLFELAPNAQVVVCPDPARTEEWLLDLESRELPDVVHLNRWRDALFAFRSPKLVVAHRCATDAGADHRVEVEGALRSSDFVVTTSKSALKTLHDRVSFRKPEKVIYNGRSGQPVPDTLRYSVFAAGSLSDPARNLRTVVAAAPRIHAPVKIAGPGECDDESVMHLGPLNRAGMVGALSEAAIYLHPAVCDPFGLSILDAALAGCALVLGDTEPLPELWNGGAVYVPPQDADAICAAVNDLLADESRRDQMARRARERASQFNTGRMAIEYRDVYVSLASERRDVTLRGDGWSASLQTTVC